MAAGVEIGVEGQEASVSLFWFRVSSVLHGELSTGAMEMVAGSTTQAFLAVGVMSEIACLRQQWQNLLSANKLMDSNRLETC
jgi:hypothetical protein